MNMGCLRITKLERVFILCMITLLSACQLNAEKVNVVSPPGYNLASPVKIQLRSDLEEISGINYFAKDTSVFAINDEMGILYKIFIRDEIKIESWKFSKQGDYEDLHVVDSFIYILQSNGTLRRLQFFGKDSLQVMEYRIPLKGKNEFESLYYDPSIKKLVMICKDCKDDSKKSVSAYGFEPEKQSFTSEAIFTMKGKKIVKKSEVDRDKFKPSAAAIHPITNELYIISTVNKTLVVAEKTGKVKEIYDLDQKIFKQPEGITFTPDGTMLISNEGAGIGPGEILIFKFKKG